MNETIAQGLIGADALDQAALDRKLIELDGTPNKKISARTRCSAFRWPMRTPPRRSPISRSFVISAAAREMFLPVPMMNILNGGAHSDAPIDFQEFMIMPKGAPTFAEALRYGAEVFHSLKEVLKDRGLSTAIGDEGGFAPNLKSAEDALECIATAVEKAGYKFGEQIFIALDPASSEFYDKETSALRLQKIRWLESDRGRVDRSLRKAHATFPDHLDRRRLRGKRLGGLEEIDRAARRQNSTCRRRSFCHERRVPAQRNRTGTANSILVKVNQIGTLTETLDAIRLATENNYTAVISHRSGETEDTTIADIAVATNAGQIKTGSLCRTDRVAKYNQLLRIAEELGDKAVYGGKMR